MPPLFIEELTGQHMYRAGSRTPADICGLWRGRSRSKKTAYVCCRRQGINTDGEALASVEFGNI